MTETFRRCQNGEVYNGGCCPKCLSTKTEASGHMDGDHQYLTAEMYCPCGYRWNDVFRLQGYEEIEQ